MGQKGDMEHVLHCESTNTRYHRTKFSRQSDLARRRFKPLTYIYIHIYTRTHPHIYTCTYTHVHKYILTHLRTYIHTYTHTCTIYVHTNIHKTYIHTYACIHTYIHTYTYTHIHVYKRCLTEVKYGNQSKSGRFVCVMSNF
jgi:hypothetical protein